MAILGIENIETYNKDVTNWAQNTGQKLRGSIRGLTSKGKGDLVKSLRMKTRKDYGMIDRISYSFERHGVFLHKGVGRGYVAQGNGVVMRIPSGKNKVLTDASLKRKPVEWFNPVIDANINNLADRVANFMADSVVNATRMKIN